MEMRRISTWEWIVALTVIASLCACTKKSGSASNLTAQAITTSSPTPSPTPQSSATPTPTPTPGVGASTTTGPVVAVRNFQSVYSNMLASAGVVPLPGSATTGAPSTDPIVTEYNLVSSRFSIGGGDTYSPPMALAAIQLALPVCQNAVKNKKLPLPAGDDPTVATNTIASLSTTAEQQALIEALEPQFLGATNDQVTAAIVTGLQTVIANPAARSTTNAQLSTAVLFVCIELAASPQAMTNMPMTTAAN